MSSSPSVSSPRRAWALLAPTWVVLGVFLLAPLALMHAGANKAALERIAPEIRNDPSIHPPKEVLDRCELLEDLGETTRLVDELWTEIKAQ